MELVIGEGPFRKPPTIIQAMIIRPLLLYSALYFGIYKTAYPYIPLLFVGRFTLINNRAKILDELYNLFSSDI